MADAAGRIVLAIVIGAHGTRGEVRLRSFASRLDYGPLARGDGGPPLELLSLRPARDGLIARFSGVNDRNAAEALQGIELSVDRDRLPEPEPDSFYLADLIGLTALRRDGTILGEVIAVHNYGAGDVIELRLTEGGDTMLLPFTSQTVPEIDIAAGRLLVDPPEGMLE